MDAKTRNSEAMELLDYGFNTVKLNKLKSKGEVLKEVKINKGNVDKVNLVLKDDLSVIEESGSGKRKYEFKYDIKEIKLPLKKGDVVGKVKVYFDGNNVTTGDVCVSEDVNSLSFFELFYNELVNLICGEY